MNEDKPKTVKQLIEKTQETTGENDKEIYLAIQELEKNNLIKLGSSKIKRELPESLEKYLFGKNYFVIEFWVLTILICTFFPIGLLIPADSTFFFVRIVFGVLFGLFIPGWTVTNLIFPRLYENIDQLERVLIAVGINIGIIIFSGLILNDVWLIDSISFVLTIGIFSIIIHILSTILRILIGSKVIELEYGKIRKKVARINIFKKSEER
jgi:uncharacterized membrane protein